MRVVCLAGGVGGAKLAKGCTSLAPGELTVIVNSGDDLERHSLTICPDQTRSCTPWRDRGPRVGLAAIRGSHRCAGPAGRGTWFRLGDGTSPLIYIGPSGCDAASVRRRSPSRWRALGVPSRVLPMADEPFGLGFERTAAGSTSRTTSSAPAGARRARGSFRRRRTLAGHARGRRGISGCRGDRGGALQSDRLDRRSWRSEACARRLPRQAAGVRAVGVSGSSAQGFARTGRQDDASLGEEATALGWPAVCVGAAARYVRDRRLDESLAGGVRALDSSRGHRHGHDDVAARVRLARDVLAAATAARRERPGVSGPGVSRANLSRIVAVVPVRSLSGAKSRLGSRSTARSGPTGSGAAAPDRAAALSSRPLRRGGGLAGRRPAGTGPGHGRGLAPAAERRLNEGLTEARDSACGEATALLVLPADLPESAPKPSIDWPRQPPRRPPARRIGRGGAGFGQARTGTNALLIMPPDASRSASARAAGGPRGGGGRCRRRTWSSTGHSLRRGHTEDLLEADRIARP